MREESRTQQRPQSSQNRTSAGNLKPSVLQPLPDQKKEMNLSCANPVDPAKSFTSNEAFSATATHYERCTKASRRTSIRRFVAFTTTTSVAYSCRKLPFWYTLLQGTCRVGNVRKRQGVMSHEKLPSLAISHLEAHSSHTFANCTHSHA